MDLERRRFIREPTQLGVGGELERGCKHLVAIHPIIGHYRRVDRNAHVYELDGRAPHAHRDRVEPRRIAGVRVIRISQWSVSYNKPTPRSTRSSSPRVATLVSRLPSTLALGWLHD